MGTDEGDVQRKPVASTRSLETTSSMRWPRRLLPGRLREGTRPYLKVPHWIRFTMPPLTPNSAARSAWLVPAPEPR